MKQNVNFWALKHWLFDFWCLFCRKTRRLFWQIEQIAHGVLEFYCDETFFFERHLKSTSKNNKQMPMPSINARFLLIGACALEMWQKLFIAEKSVDRNEELKLSQFCLFSLKWIKLQKWFSVFGHTQRRFHWRTTHQKKAIIKVLWPLHTTLSILAVEMASKRTTHSIWISMGFLIDALCLFCLETTFDTKKTKANNTVKKIKRKLIWCCQPKLF